MRIALAIFRLSPRGGLEDNCIRIAAELQRRGHEVTCFVAGESATVPMPVVTLPGAAKRRTNHARMAAFARDVSDVCERAHGKCDRLVAFQTIPGADILFHADRIKNPANTPLWKRLTPRHRTFARLEAECFRVGTHTRIIGLAPQQMQPFTERYGTEPGRIVIAPPTLSRDKWKPERRTLENRAAARSRHALDPQAQVWLWLGLAPKTKGLDRALAALALSPGAHLLIGGLAAHDHAMRPMSRLAQRLGVAARIHCLGYVSGDTLLDAMAASDALAHPARADVTGGVILESIINGLPVVATDVCGFSHHILESDAGAVLAHPHDSATFARLLHEVCGERNLTHSANGIRYSRQTDLFSGIERVCDIIEGGK